MRRMRATAVVVAVLLALAGCSEIPTTGTVQPGTTEAPNGTSIAYLPNPPASGASASEIVAGFLTAASGGGAFSVAKEYLTKDFAQTWKPTKRVLVQATQASVTTGRGADISVDVPIAAQVNSKGVYQPSSGSETLPFHLVQQGGQWRIDSAEDGIVLSQTVFQRNYSPRALEFFDPTWKRLVPDWRWFASTLTSGTSEPSPRSVVDQLIAGPAGPIAGGITVNALTGANVATIDPGNDLTTVMLNLPGVAPSAALTTRIQQQLVQSLALPTPSSLRLFVNGSQIPPAKALASQTLSPLPFVVSGGRFGTVAANGAFTEARVLNKRIAALKPRAVTVVLQQKLAAVQTSSGDVAVVTATGQRFVDTRPDLAEPTLDQRGWTYSVPKQSPNGLIASNAKGDQAELGVDLGGTGVTAIEVSPDGTRLLVLVQDEAARPKAFVYGILRDSDGTPDGLSTSRYPVDLGGNVGQGVDATWVDDGNVAVLVKSPDQSTERVRLQQLGGLGSSLGELPNAVAIVGSTGKESVRVLLGTGDIWVQQSNLWQSESAEPVDVSVLAVQR